MRESILNLHGVEKSYRQGNTRLEVLRGLNLEVLAGETVALMAPSGAGKDHITSDCWVTGSARFRRSLYRF